MAPYPGWEVFRKRIIRALTAYIEIAKPAGVEASFPPLRESNKARYWLY